MAASAQVDPSAHVGPYCVVGEKTRIGARSILQDGNHIGPNCHLGDDVNLFPNVTIYARSEIGNRVRDVSNQVYDGSIDFAKRNPARAAAGLVAFGFFTGLILGLWRKSA